MANIGVIGGSGFYDFPELEHISTVEVKTPYGSVQDVLKGEYFGHSIFFLPRHGADHKTPPHKINFRANIAAFALLDVTKIIAFNATGGIRNEFAPGTLIIPNQIIDYTYDRHHTFCDGFENVLQHIDFTHPFDNDIQLALEKSLLNFGDVKFHFGGTYGCTQGPRLETAAEIKKLQRDGCDLVGMTLMPEAALAREKKINYASLCFVVNWAAGISESNISLDNIMALLNSSVPQIREVILKTIRFF